MYVPMSVASRTIAFSVLSYTQVLISHWGSAQYFEPAARCLLLAGKDVRLGHAIASLGPEPSFAKKSLSARLAKALGASPAAAAGRGKQQPCSSMRGAECGGHAQLVALQMLLR